MSTLRDFCIALPKKGRLKEDFTAIFDYAELMLEKNNDRHDYGTVYSKNPGERPFTAVAQSAKDALLNLQDGIVDAAIVGKDTFEEKKAAIESGGQVFNGKITAAFNFASCSLQIAAPESASLKTPKDLENKKIATSYPAALCRWLDNNGVSTNNIQIIERDGGIEDYVRMGMADAICDIVDTGRSLKANGLVPYFRLFASSAVFVENTTTQNKERVSELKQKLVRAAGILFPFHGHQIQTTNSANQNTAETATVRPACQHKPV